MRFEGVCLITRRISEMARFYENVLGASLEVEGEHVAVDMPGHLF